MPKGNLGKYIGSKMLKQFKNYPTDWGTVTKIGLGGLGAVIVGGAVAGAIDSAYAANVKSLGIFDIEIDCQNCSPQERQAKETEISDMLARYLRKNMGDVKIHRYRGNRQPEELPGMVGEDDFVIGVISIQASGAIDASVERIDNYPHNTGSRSYTFSANNLDSAIRSLADRITVDVGGEIGVRISSATTNGSDVKTQRLENFKRMKGDMSDKQFESWLIEKFGPGLGLDAYGHYRRLESE